MQKFLYFIFIAFLFQNSLIAEENNEISKNLYQEMQIVGISKEDFAIQNKRYNGEDFDFDLKIKIPDGWMLDSNEKQDNGRPLQIKLKESDLVDNLIVNFPKSINHEMDLGDKKITNHVYVEGVTIPMKIKNFDSNKNYTLDISYLICGGEGNCIPGNHEIVVEK